MKRQRISRHGNPPGCYQYNDNVIITVKESGRLWFNLYDFDPENPTVLMDFYGKCYYKINEMSFDFGDFTEWGPSSRFKTLNDAENYIRTLPEWKYNYL